MYVYTSFSCELILLLNHFTTTEFYYCLTLQLPKVTTARTIGHGGRQEARAFLRQRLQPAPTPQVRNDCARAPRGVLVFCACVYASTHAHAHAHAHAHTHTHTQGKPICSNEKECNPAPKTLPAQINRDFYQVDTTVGCLRLRVGFMG